MADLTRNLIVFSDGTGNSAAKPFKTNVWRLYQALSLTLTPFYQSDSRWLPALRDILVPIATTVPPLPQFLAALVAGRLLYPLKTLELKPVLL